jgi:hypothetical protein
MLLSVIHDLKKQPKVDQMLFQGAAGDEVVDVQPYYNKRQLTKQLVQKPNS